MERLIQAGVRRRLLLQAATAAGVAPALAGCRADSRHDAAATPGAIGTNLSGMEWCAPHVRRGASTQANLHYTVPRRAEIAWLAGQGFRRNRLPVLWEMLQPVLADSAPDAATRALVGEPGALHAEYARWITDVLDAHAAVGATCILDIHNYGRYRDFRYDDAGRVAGLRLPPTPWHRPWTEDPAGWRERIISLAPGATLTPAHLADLWRRIALRWKDHPGLGGWGLMNEPHDLPAPGGTEATRGGGEDLRIWPACAQAAIDAIRAVDARTPILVAGNAWSAAMALPTHNPGFPLRGEGLVYEVHLYLDAGSTGQAFDWDTETGKRFAAGLGRRPIDRDTGVQRLEPALQWARRHGQRLALTEIGMPLDDVRWQDAFERTAAHALRHGVDVLAWAAGSHWPVRHHPIHQVPGWLQDRTLVPAVSGALLAAAGREQAVLYDQVAPPAADGSVAVTVRVRGALAQPLVLALEATQGRVEPDTVQLPAGANGSVSLRCHPAADRVMRLHYRAPDRPPGVPLPPGRRIPGAGVAEPQAAARSLMARWGASCWRAADAWTDYVGGAPARPGEVVRAIADSGFGGRVDRPMEMVCSLNTDCPPGGGAWQPPRLAARDGLSGLACGDAGRWGLWCRMPTPEAGVLPRPGNRMPFDLQDPQLLMAWLVPEAGSTGVVLQASQPEGRHLAELALDGGVPQARWVQPDGRQMLLRAPRPLPPGRPVVLAAGSGPDGAWLRVGGERVAAAGQQLSAGVFTQLLLGWGFVHWWPQPGFRGLLLAALAARAEPDAQALDLVERHLASAASGGASI